jgi:hypothetical protein
MEAKLRSISKQIHWSSALKAAIFALAWFWFPFWLFALVALYLYFIPIFRSGKLAIPFFVLLALSYFQSSGILFALVFGAIFYVMLLIKDLLVIERRSAYELLVLILSFLALRAFYITFDGGASGAALAWAFLIAAAIALLIHSFIRCFAEEVAVGIPVKKGAGWLTFLFVSQILIVGLFLPLDFVYQSVIVFLTVFLFIDLLPEYLFGGLSPTKVLTAATAVFALFTIVLASAHWGL